MSDIKPGVDVNTSRASPTSTSASNFPQLAAARLKLATTGKSPRQIGIESLRRTISFIYMFGFSTAQILLLLLGRTSSGYANKLAKQGWLIATKTESGVPAYYFTLSECGLQEAERLTPRLLHYIEIDPYRVDQQLIKHDLIAQNVTVNALNAGLISHFETERMLEIDGCQQGMKLPDIVWHTKEGVRIAIEIELSAKWGRDLDDFVLGVARALQSDGKNVGYARFAVFSNSPAIIERYRAAMQPGASVRLWKKNERKHWTVDKTYMVPDWLSSKVDFRLLGE